MEKALDAKMEYTDQTSYAIRFYLALGTIDFSQFTILEERRFAFNDFSLYLAIIGESHILCIKKAEEVLNEICACTDAEIPPKAKLLSQNLLSNVYPNPLTMQFGNYAYSFRYAFEDWELGGRRLAMLRELRQTPAVHTLQYVFPSHEDVPEVAVTEIYLALSEGIKIETVHTYPNESLMVFTETNLIQNAPT